MCEIKFSFIGFTQESSQIADCLCANGQQEEKIYTQINTFVHPDWEHRVQPLDYWHELLAQPQPTVIIVSLALTTSDNQEILRKLVAAGCCVAVVRPDSDCLFAYELEMIRVESEGCLYPIHFRPLDLNASWVNANQISVHAPVDVSNLDEVMTHLTRDLLQLHSSIGNAKYIFAVISGANEIAPGISITIETEGAKLVHWRSDARELPASVFSDATGIEHSANSSFDENDILRLAVSQETRNKIIGNRKWIEYATAREAAEMIPLSLKRGRKIELFNVPPTETDAFKGVMSGAGCFILLLTLAVIGLFAVFDIARLSDLRDIHQTTLENNPSTVSPSMPLFFRLWPVYPLILFLAFQFLRRIIKPSDPHHP